MSAPARISFGALQRALQAQSLMRGTEQIAALSPACREYSARAGYVEHRLRHVSSLPAWQSAHYAGWTTRRRAAR